MVELNYISDLNHSLTGGAVCAMVSFRRTLKNIKCDYVRRLHLERSEGVLSRLAVWVKPGMVGVICYRLSHYFVYTRFKFLCRLLMLLEHAYSRNELSPYSEIGPGLVLGDIGAIGITPHIEIGKNCTFMGFNTVSLNGVAGVDFTVDQIIIGDHCVFGNRSKVMKPLRIANGAQVKDNSLVIFDVKLEGSTVSGVPARRQKVDSYPDIVKWNPFFGGLIN